MKTLSLEIQRITSTFDQYARRLKEIRVYLDISQKQKDFILNNEEIFEHLLVCKHEGFKNKEVLEYNKSYINELSSITNSAVLYNAAIISLYGSFELYIDELLKGYISFLGRNVNDFHSLPDNLQEKQLHKSAEFILNSNRFLNYDITEKGVISSLNESFNNNSTKHLIEELLISHGGNLKGKQLRELFREFGFQDIDSFLYRNMDFDLFEEKFGYPMEVELNRQDHLFDLLEQIVDERNAVAHGWVVDNRKTFDFMLKKYLPYLYCLCQSINLLICSSIINHYIEKDKLICLGLSDSIHYSGKVIGINNKDAYLSIGKELYYKDKYGDYYLAKIESLTRDKKDRQKIISKGIVVGIGLNRKIHKEDLIYYEK